MKFELSDDQQLLRSSARDFLERELPLEKTRKVMEHDPRGFDRGSWGQIAEMGYLGLHLPEAAGGQGLGAIELAIVLEEMGRVCLPGPYLDAALAARLLADAGGQERLVGDVVAGKKLVTIARYDSAFLGNDGQSAHFREGRVRGTKYFVPAAADADALLVATPEGVALVEGPFEATPLPTIDLSQRFGRVDLDHPGTRVAESSLLERNDVIAATGAAAMLLGLMSRALEITVEYVKARQAFGRPIGAFQALQHRLAEMLLRVESTRSAVYRAAWCFDTGAPETALAAATAKAYGGDAARLVCGESIQMHGGIGFTWEVDLHFYFKRVKTLEQLYGSTEAQLERALAAAGY
jgi:alkylation response protein AidB-like acyl-CoA dehydrogenase